MIPSTQKARALYLKRRSLAVPAQHEQVECQPLWLQRRQRTRALVFFLICLSKAAKRKVQQKSGALDGGAEARGLTCKTRMKISDHQPLQVKNLQLRWKSQKHSCLELLTHFGLTSCLRAQTYPSKADRKGMAAVRGWGQPPFFYIIDKSLGPTKPAQPTSKKCTSGLGANGVLCFILRSSAEVYLVLQVWELLFGRVCDFSCFCCWLLCVQVLGFRKARP